jgi:hypothetical protein
VKLSLSSTLLKILGLVVAGLGAFQGPGIPPKLQTWAVVAGTAFTALIHTIDSIFNSPSGTPPVA